MSRGIEQIGKYVDRLADLQSGMTGELNVAAAMRMLVVLKCLERALTAYLSKQKF